MEYKEFKLVSSNIPGHVLMKLHSERTDLPSLVPFHITPPTVPVPIQEKEKDDKKKMKRSFYVSSDTKRVKADSEMLLVSETDTFIGSREETSSSYVFFMFGVFSTRYMRLIV